MWSKVHLRLTKDMPSLNVDLIVIVISDDCGNHTTVLL